MLAWWGILPVIGYAVMYAVYGYPVAKVRATGSAYVVSYFLGGLIAAPLFSLGFGWAAYRVFRRSQRAGTIIFTLMLCLFTFSTFKQSQRLSAGPQGAAPQSVLQQYPLAGIAMTGPAGWIEMRPDREKLVTRWMSPDSVPPHAQALVMIEMQRTPDTDARVVAQNLAKGWGGQVLEQSESLDGEKAWRVRAEPTQQGLRPVEAVVTIRDGYVYSIQGGVVPGKTCRAEVDAVRASWKWSAFESPVAHHLALRQEPLLLLGGSATMQVPEAMVTFDTDKNETMAGLLVHNRERRADDFKVTLTRVEIPEGDTFANARERIAAGIHLFTRRKERVNWRSLDLTPQIWVTNPVPGPDSEPDCEIVWALVEQMDGRSFYFLSFMIYATDANARNRYEELCELMAQTVKPVRRNQPSPP